MNLYMIVQRELAAKNAGTTARFTGALYLILGEIANFPCLDSLLTSWQQFHPSTEHRKRKG